MALFTIPLNLDMKKLLCFVMAKADYDQLYTNVVLMSFECLL